MTESARTRLSVEVAYALPDEQFVVSIEVSRGATVRDVLDIVRNRAPFAGLDLDRMPVGIFGTRVEHAHVLRDGDRVELYRELRADAKTQRRLRAAAAQEPGSDGSPSAPDVTASLGRKSPVR